MSESLPYRGWQLVRVRKYLDHGVSLCCRSSVAQASTHAVAIQLVELSAFRSLPILAYCRVVASVRWQWLLVNRIAHRRHGEKLVKGTQENANAYGGQQDVQPLGHLGDAFPSDLAAAIFGGEGLTSPLDGPVR